MTIARLHVVIGTIVPTSQVFKNVMDNSEEFRQNLQGVFEDGFVTSNWTQFQEFINDGAPQENNPEKWSEDEYDELSEIFVDWSVNLPDYEWTVWTKSSSSLSSGTNLEIIKIPHDMKHEAYHVVGKVIETLDKEKSYEIDIKKVNETASQLKQDNQWKDVKVYLIPDDCSCCT